MIRARILRRLIAPFNWHHGGRCRFPVLCMYDDMLIWELDGLDKRHASWRRARRYRRFIDQASARYVRGQSGP
jgi:hypothetical protein